MKLNEKIFSYIKKRNEAHCSSFILCGGRRSGKTFAICQRLLLLCYTHKRIVNVASMTMEQGRLGAYADMKTLIQAEPLLNHVFKIKTTPREIINLFNGSQIFFNSYQNSETAKGVACDYLFLNEANNFSEQQFTDLMLNVRRAVYMDYNPNILFWVDKYYQKEDILVTTWKDNPFLTDAQKQEFERLKERAFSPTATSRDKYLYNVYYLGQFVEIEGDFFNPGNIQRIEAKDLPDDIRHCFIYCDPSALVGNDFFACVFASYSRKTNKIYILDTYSINTGTQAMIVNHLKQWCLSRDSVEVYVETNGVIGAYFYQFCINSNLQVNACYEHRNKYERILSNYNDIIEKVVFVNNERTENYLEQIYSFKKDCEHDDHIDAIAGVLQQFRNQYSIV